MFTIWLELDLVVQNFSSVYLWRKFKAKIWYSQQ
jgi:hypothetical protein